MSKKIVLSQEMVLATDLQYDEAIQLLERADASPAAQYIDFFISASSHSERYKLIGHSIQLRKLFMENPNDFIIEG